MATKAKQKHRVSKKKSLTYAITQEREEEIKKYVDTVHAKTRIPKGHIVSEILIEGIRKAKKFYPNNLVFSDNSEKEEEK